MHSCLININLLKKFVNFLLTFLCFGHIILPQYVITQKQGKKMKKIALSIVTALTMTSVAFAGGDIAPVEPEVSVPEVVSTPGSFYVGLGYSYVTVDYTTGDDSADSVLLLAGYNFNNYIGVEGRYTFENSDKVSNAGIYLKGMLPVTDAFGLYALAGYGKTDIETFSESGFQYGIGANYALTENIGLFVDYVRMYDDNGFDGATDLDVTVDAVSVGATYKF